MRPLRSRGPRTLHASNAAAGIHGCCPWTRRPRSRISSPIERGCGWRSIVAMSMPSSTPRILASGWGSTRPAAVRQLRKLLNENSESWEELRAVLALGGGFSSSTAFAAPYVYSRWPESLDSFDCAAVIGRNVRLRTAARLDAPILTTVSYSIVRRLESNVDKQWSSVRLGDGRSGYIWHAYVRSPV